MSDNKETTAAAETTPRRARISKLALLVSVIAAAFAAWIFIAAQGG